MQTEVISKNQLDTLLTAMLKNTRISSSLSLAKLANTTSAIVDEIISLLKATDYVKVYTFPSGKFKTHRFTRKGSIIYTDYCRVYINGKQVHPIGLVFSGEEYKYPLSVEKRAEYQSTAIRMGIPFVIEGPKGANSSFQEALTTQLYSQLNAEFIKFTTASQIKTAEEEKYKIFTHYDDALTKYKTLEIEISTLQQRLTILQDTDESTLKEYNQQMHLTQIGKRTKEEAYSVVVGTETVIRKGTAWCGFSSEEVYTDWEKTVNVYETRYRAVPNPPAKPQYNTDEINTLTQKINALTKQLRHIEVNFVHVDQEIKKENQTQMDYQQYLKERAELDRKYNNRFK
jgi:hypothetical protein